MTGVHSSASSQLTEDCFSFKLKLYRYAHTFNMISSSLSSPRNELKPLMVYSMLYVCMPSRDFLNAFLHQGNGLRFRFECIIDIDQVPGQFVVLLRH